MGQDKLISVITIVYNSADCLEKTILSVINQSYPNIEYIVVDGASKDGSMDIINKYRDQISVVLSEPDKGPYDAINKGFDLAKGEWINIMNAGDWFMNEDVVKNLVPYLNDEVDIVYGDTESRSQDHRIIPGLPESEINQYWKKCKICAQSLFVKNYIAKKIKFDLRYPIQSYYDWMLKCVEEGYKFRKADLIVSSYMGGGMSALHPIRENIDRWKIVTLYKTGFMVHLHFCFRISRVIMTQVFLKMLSFFNEKKCFH